MGVQKHNPPTAVGWGNVGAGISGRRVQGQEPGNGLLAPAARWGSRMKLVDFALGGI